MSWTVCWRYLVLGHLPHPWSILCQSQEEHQLQHIACDLCQHDTHGAPYDVLYLQPLQNRRKMADRSESTREDFNVVAAVGCEPTPPKTYVSWHTKIISHNRIPVPRSLKRKVSWMLFCNFYLRTYDVLFGNHIDLIIHGAKIGKTFQKCRFLFLFFSWFSLPLANFG